MRAVDLAVASFLLLGACLVWPVLSIVNRSALVLGVPLLVLYLFVLWAGLVAVAAIVARQAHPPGEDQE